MGLGRLSCSRFVLVSNLLSGTQQVIDTQLTRYSKITLSNHRLFIQVVAKEDIKSTKDIKSRRGFLPMRYIQPVSAKGPPSPHAWSPAERVIGFTTALYSSW